MPHTHIQETPEVETTVLSDLVTLAQGIHSGVVTPTTPMIDLGFDSLASLELAIRVEDELDIACTLEDVLDAVDLNELAAILLARRGNA